MRRRLRCFPASEGEWNVELFHGDEQLAGWRRGVALMVLPAALPETNNGKGATMELKKYNVTVQRFDPNDMAKMEEFVLPVNCPDEEHAAASVLSNLISWSTKTSGGKVLPVAFRCVGVVERAG